MPDESDPLYDALKKQVAQERYDDLLKQVAALRVRSDELREVSQRLRRQCNALHSHCGATKRRP